MKQTKQVLFVSLLLLSFLLSSCQKAESSSLSSDVSRELSEEDNSSSDKIEETSSIEESEESSIVEESSEETVISETEEESEESSLVEDTEEEDSSEEEIKKRPVVLKRVPFEEITVADNEECTIKITKVDYDDTWRVILNVYMENKTSDNTLVYRIRDAAVNGITYDAAIYSELEPGESINEEAYIEIIDYSDAMPVITTDDITDIELPFFVFYTDFESINNIVDETVHIYPYGEEYAIKFERDAQPSDNIIVDNDYVTVIISGLGNRNHYRS